MPGKYNILPYALGADYHILAEQSDILIPPLRLNSITITVEPFQTGIQLSADSIVGHAYIHVASMSVGLDLVCPATEMTVAIVPLDAGVSVDIGSIFRGFLITIPPLSTGVDAQISGVAQTIPLASFQTGLLFLSPVTHSAIVPPAFDIGLLAVLPVVYTFTTEHADIYFIFVLTGAADGEEDVEVPISSFQARRRSGEPTYLQVVIPSLDAADDIAARPNGTMQVDMAYKIDGVWVQRETIIEADFEELRVDEGIFSQSITLTGYKTLTPTAKTVTLTGATYRSTTNGKIRYRIAKPYIYLNPGDTVTIGSDTFTADVISYYYGATKTGVAQNMEIAEA